MSTLFKYWARGMAFFGGLAAVIAFWNYVILPLFYNYAAFRFFAAFVIVSVVAIIFGGVMSCHQPIRAADEYPELGEDE